MPSKLYGRVTGRKSRATIMPGPCAPSVEFGRQGGVGDQRTRHHRRRVGIPGSLSPLTVCMCNANLVWLNGKHLDADLAEVLERPVWLANDASCFALSKAVDGASSGGGRCLA